jgi:hypothetical protein
MSWLIYMMESGLICGTGLNESEDRYLGCDWDGRDKVSRYIFHERGSLSIVRKGCVHF